MTDKNALNALKAASAELSKKNSISVCSETLDIMKAYVDGGYSMAMKSTGKNQISQARRDVRAVVGLSFACETLTTFKPTSPAEVIEHSTGLKARLQKKGFVFDGQPNPKVPGLIPGGNLFDKSPGVN